MILRRATDLSTGDNVRLEDGRLWNVAEVFLFDSRCVVHLSRTIGEKMVLELFPDDLILLAI
jgi:hypothetical protein